MTKEPRRRFAVRALASTVPEAALFFLAGHLADAATSAWMISVRGPQAEINQVWAAFVVSPGWVTLANVLNQQLEFALWMVLCAVAWEGRGWSWAYGTRRGRAVRAVVAVLAMFSWLGGYASFILGAGVNVAVAVGVGADVLDGPLAAWALFAGALVVWFERQSVRERTAVTP